MKVKKDCTIYEENFDYVNQIKVDRNTRSFSAALDIIISEHKNNNNDQVNAIADSIISKLDQKYDKLLTRIRLGVNTADINSQVMIEILNSIIMNEGMEKSYLTKTLETDIVRESREEVKKRIEHYKQLKDDKKK